MQQSNQASQQQGSRPQRLHISHRRSPSELTPFMMEQYALQQQIELLQAQQQLLHQQQQYAAQTGMMPPPSYVPSHQQMGGYTAEPIAAAGAASGFASTGMGQIGAGAGAGPGAHRRGGSNAFDAFPGGFAAAQGGRGGAGGMVGMGMGMGMSSGQRQPGPPPAGQGHSRRHSLALPEAKQAAERAQRVRQESASGATSASSFSFPARPDSSGGGEQQQQQQQQQGGAVSGGRSRVPGHGRSQSMAVGGGRSGAVPERGFSFPSAPPGSSGGQPGGGGHARSSSRNFDGNWRASAGQQPTGPEQQQQQQQQFFVPGHRSRASMSSSMSSNAGFGGFSFPQQAPGALNLSGMGGMGGMNIPQPLLSPQLMQQQQLVQLQGQGGAQQQRKSLFSPYLPQATLPALLSDGRLVSGVLRVNKKNRSDAYVSTELLDADIFICGSKDRNRALEGDFVAVELLDVDEVWNAKREKEEKKRRKEGFQMSGGSTSQAEGTGLKRQGSIRNRPEVKKKDDVEVEGQGLLLVDEEEVSDEMKPMYAGHVVAVIERTPGQMFSGTLGLLRPSSAATKEKQDQERMQRGERPEGGRSNDRPKIVWFKPTDKRVPLIAIPTEQAPKDFVENHQKYANKLFVACIKRWPITSLHPFGTLIEELGDMGNVEVETEALLRDNNFLNEAFSEACIKSIPEPIDLSNEEELELRGNFSEERVFSLDVADAKAKGLNRAMHIKGLEEGKVEIGIHISDVGYYVRPNSVLDREAKKRGTAVFLTNRAVPMFPSELVDLCSLAPGETKPTFSIVFKMDETTGDVEGLWIGRSIASSVAHISYEDADAVLEGGKLSGEVTSGDEALRKGLEDDLSRLCRVTTVLRRKRLGSTKLELDSLRLLAELDDEDLPQGTNLFESTAAAWLVEELMMKAEIAVAEKINEKFSEGALLRRHPRPQERRLRLFLDKAKRLGYEIDGTDGASLQRSLLQIDDLDIRKALETLLVKTLHRARYFVSGRVDADYNLHFINGLPLYTHFTAPLRRYADLVVHRQLEAAVTGVDVLMEDYDALGKTAEMCNSKKDASKNAQEQSMLLRLCHQINNAARSNQGPIIYSSVVVSVYESAFDILVPELGIEKRVHLDQLPLKTADFTDARGVGNRKMLELFWLKGVDTATYVPRTSETQSSSVYDRTSSMADDELSRKFMDISTQEPNDEGALFDDDDEIVSSPIDVNAKFGFGSHPSKSEPISPVKGSAANTPFRTQSTSSMPSGSLNNRSGSNGSGDALSFEGLSSRGGDHIQAVKELTRLPVMVFADLSKAPPVVTVRPLNPFM
ncbi:Translational repressor [Saitoella coloradoensis]